MNERERRIRAQEPRAAGGAAWRWCALFYLIALVRMGELVMHASAQQSG